MSSVVWQMRSFQQIQELTAETTADFLGSKFEDPETFLNQIHQHIDVAELNSLRLNGIRQMNAQAWFRNSIFNWPNWL